MTGYLTNTKLTNKNRCEYAAMVSGFDVIFLDYPMPINHYDYDMEFYSPDNFIGVYGCVYTNEPSDKDHGPFWRAWDNYKDGIDQ